MLIHSNMNTRLMLQLNSLKRMDSRITCTVMQQYTRKRLEALSKYSQVHQDIDYNHVACKGKKGLYGLMPKAD